MKYLHKHGPHTWSLDHRLTPECRAMLTAMTSRMPLGGLEQRYREVVDAVARDHWLEHGGARELATLLVDGRAATIDEALQMTEVVWAGELDSPDDPPVYVADFVKSTLGHSRGHAEERLCEYPLHPKVQAFFDKFVGLYGHGSVLEGTGDPAVYVDGISWYTAYLLFDSPLVVGQENSTRAVTRKGWPMCRETQDWVPWSAELEAEYDARIAKETSFSLQMDQKVLKDLTRCVGGEHRANADLQELHENWMAVFEAEKAAWEERLADPAERAKLRILDKEPFRPALDRARWALPGTISTGAAFTSHVRERARVLRDAKAVYANSRAAWDVVDEVERAYRAAVPGIAQYGLREAVYGEGGGVPHHLRNATTWDMDLEVTLTTNHGGRGLGPEYLPARRAREYADRSYNRYFTVEAHIPCALSEARDWHRQRTFDPWELRVMFEDGELVLDHHYAPISALGRDTFTDLMHESSRLFAEFRAAGDHGRAMLCLPFGTSVLLSGSAGLRDALYSLELRYYAVGANFAYKDQAGQALCQLAHELNEVALADHLGLSDFLTGLP